ncbi:universal stress protein [Salinarimonas rosea]|uniref:universal stress protein n=1 Tax=Salinarimonas rosea TaxID=552063 RepID=UPI0004015717|nr:universal stress protein [Salinarimonas rosea]
MPHLVACIDGSIYSHSVADHAAWAAARLGASVELLQVLGRRDVSSTDLSGSLPADARVHVLEQLAEVDAQRARLLLDKARIVMDEARARVRDAGVGAVETTLRHGDLLDEVAAREAGADMIVVGKRGEAADFARLHLGSNLERLVRAAHKPVLVASRGFRQIDRVLVAFDGGPSALKAVDHVSRSPLFAGLAIHIVTAGAVDAEARRRLDAAAAQIGAGGAAVETHLEAGTPHEVIAAHVERLGIDLLVMGAYGHTRLRNLFIGSTTTEMMRTNLVPVLLFR